MSEMIPFTYEGTPMRTVVVESEPWFVSMDALDILGLHRSSLTALDDDEKGVHTVDTLGGVQPDGHVTISKTPKVTGKGQTYLVNHYLKEMSK